MASSPFRIILDIADLALKLLRGDEARKPSSPDISVDIRWSGDWDLPAEPRQANKTIPAATVAPPRSSTPVSVSQDDAEATCWVPAGRAIDVGPFHIPGGLFYVGRQLPASAAYIGPDPALIDPALRLDTARPDRAGKGMDYWPSYAKIDPACRAAYLEWLAGGRKDPDAYIGYVFLFFYGLERRLLRPILSNGELPPDADVIRAEVERLVGIYGQNASFASYAGDLLAMTRLASGGATEPDESPPMPRWEGDMPVAMRIGLGRFAQEGRPLPAAWALAWGLTRFAGILRTPATRCAAEFQALFGHHYREKFGAGIVIKPGRSKLAMSYRPASRTFGGNVNFRHPDLPDVARKEPPTEALRAIVDRCCDELDAYSRYLGRNPAAAGTPAALALLPPAISGDRPPALDDLLTAIETGFDAAGRAPIATDALVAAWPCAGDRKMTKAESIAVVQALVRWGIGIEPDPRFGGPVYAAGGQVVAFRLPADSPATPSPEYAAAAIVLAVGASMATADGAVASPEEAMLATFAAGAPGCTGAERSRLAAHVQALLLAPPGVAALKKRLSALSEAQRQGVWDFVLGLVMADGVVDKAEVKLLSRLAPLLGRDPEGVYESIHAASSAGRPAPSDEPVLVQQAEARVPGTAIPKPPPPASGGQVVRLDPAAIQAKLAETAAVSTLLGRVFADDEAERPPVAPPVDTPCAKGLDASHTALLAQLAGRDTIGRSDFEALAAALGLMPDGAIDTLNEAALDACDVPVAEGEDPIVLDRAVIEELLP